LKQQASLKWFGETWLLQNKAQEMHEFIRQTVRTANFGDYCRKRFNSLAA
jgi:hypothetical protein